MQRPRLTVRGRAWGRWERACRHIEAAQHVWERGLAWIRAVRSEQRGWKVQSGRGGVCVLMQRMCMHVHARQQCTEIHGAQ